MTYIDLLDGASRFMLECASTDLFLWLSAVLSLGIIVRLIFAFMGRF